MPVTLCQANKKKQEKVKKKKSKIIFKVKIKPDSTQYLVGNITNNNKIALQARRQN